jgi:hypothetical protein
MKYIVVLSSLIFLGGCSPKYAGYFHDYHQDYSSSQNISATRAILPAKKTHLDFTFPANTNAMMAPVIFKEEEKVSTPDLTQIRKNRITPQEKTINKSQTKKFKSPAGVAKQRDDQNSKSAILGFIFSIVGIVIAPLLIPAIILGAKGLKSEKRGLALVAVIIGSIALFFWVLLVLLFVAFAGGFVGLLAST